MRRGLYRLNSTVLSCRLNALNCISSRRSAGKLFHKRGPATEKLLSQKVLRVRGRKQVFILHQVLYIALCYQTADIIRSNSHMSTNPTTNSETFQHAHTLTFVHQDAPPSRGHLEYTPCKCPRF